MSFSPVTMRTAQARHLVPSQLAHNTMCISHIMSPISEEETEAQEEKPLHKVTG